MPPILVSSPDPFVSIHDDALVFDHLLFDSFHHKSPSEPSLASFPPMSLYDDLSEHADSATNDHSARSSYAPLSPSPEPRLDDVSDPRPSLPPLTTSIAPRPSTATTHTSPENNLLSPASAIDGHSHLFNVHRRASLPIIHHHPHHPHPPPHHPNPHPQHHHHHHHHHQPLSPISNHSPQPWGAPSAQYYDPFPPSGNPHPPSLSQDLSPLSFPFSSLPHSPNYELTSTTGPAGGGAYTSLDNKFNPPQYSSRESNLQQYHPHHQQEWQSQAPESSFQSSASSSPVLPRSFSQLQKRPSSSQKNLNQGRSLSSSSSMLPLKTPVPPPIKRRGKLPKSTTDLLKSWLHEHTEHPYPSEDEKRTLCAMTGLTMNQVSNWMINARRRILAPAKNGGHMLNPNNPANAGLISPPTADTPSGPGPVPPRDLLLSSSSSSPAYLSNINGSNRHHAVRPVSIGGAAHIGTSEYTYGSHFAQAPPHQPTLPPVSMYASNASLPESNHSYTFGLGGGGTPVNYHGNMGGSMLSRSLIDTPRQATPYNIAPIGIRRTSREDTHHQPASAGGRTSPSPFAYNISSSSSTSSVQPGSGNSFRPASSSGLSGLGMGINTLNPISRSPSVGASPAS